MSEKEKAFSENIAALPPALQDLLLATARGAALALDVLEAQKGGATNEQRESRVSRHDCAVK